MTQSTQKTTDTRIFYFDLIRAIAILMVVVIHVTANLLYKFNSIPHSWWWIANVFDSLARPSVPLFVMLSGALVLNPAKNESLSAFFVKRVRKVLVPLLVWSGIYLLWLIYYHGVSYSLLDAIKAFAEGSIYDHLWFLYMLLGLYLAAPILTALVRGADEKVLRYFFGLWFFIVCVVPLLNQALHLTLGVYWVVATGYVGYFLLGYYLSHYPITIQRAWPWILVEGAAILVTIFGTYALMLHNGGKYDGYFYDYLSPNVIYMAVFLFMLIKAVPNEFISNPKNLLKMAILTLSSTSFSIYLMHVIVLEVLKKGINGHGISATTLHPLVGIPGTVILTLALCAFITLALRKIPFLRFIFQ